MIVEIKGIGIPNKGAELMLAAVLEMMKSRYENVRFVVDPNTSFVGRCRFGLYQKGWMSIKGLQLASLFEFIPKKLLDRFGIVRNSDVDVIFDASGFCYSDSFGFANAYVQVGKYAQAWKKQGKKLVFLPQAYGPFEDKQLASTMEQTLTLADAYFARDKVSKEYLEKIGLTDVPSAPDFTCLIKGQVPASFNSREAGDTCIILNNRMLEKLSKEDGELYVQNMLSAIERFKALGARPYFLMHEGADDVALTQRLNAQLDAPLASYYFEDPLHIKGVIGTAKYVMSARFHGLVSALTQGIPVLAIGWSHKYQMLLEGYELAEFMLDHTNQQSIIDAIEKVCDDNHYQGLADKVRKNAQVQKELTAQMWQAVFNVVDSHANAVKRAN